MKRIPILFKIIIIIVLGLLYYVFFETLDDRNNYKILVNYVLFLFSANLLYSIFVYFYKRRKHLGSKEADNILSGSRNIYYLVITSGTIGFFLSLLGIEFEKLFTTLTIFAAAIAIVTKEYISPIIAGFHIALSKNLNIGDYVKIGELKGKIVDLKLTKLKLLSDDDDLIIISNEKAYFNEVINFTKGNIRKVSINFILSSDFEGTVDDLEKNLIDEIKEYAEFIEGTSYNLRVSDINKDTLNFKFQYELKKSDDRELEKEIRKKTVRKIVNHIKENK